MLVAYGPLSLINRQWKNVYISLPYVTVAKIAGTDRNEEITSLSLYV